MYREEVENEIRSERKRLKDVLIYCKIYDSGNKNMLRDESNRLGKVVVCTPRHEYSRASSDLKRHNIGVLGSPEMAISQHNTLKTSLRQFGAEVIDVPELVDHPNSVFTRDTALCTLVGYIKCVLVWKAAWAKKNGWLVFWMNWENLVQGRLKHLEQLKGEMSCWLVQWHLLAIPSGQIKKVLGSYRES